jgi:hypothetical protein
MKVDECETKIRADYVSDVIHHGGLWPRRWNPCYHMILTSHRIMFRRPTDGPYIRSWLSMVLRGARYVPPSKEFEICLKDIKKLWTWQPKFSALPALELREPWQPWWREDLVNEIPTNMIRFQLLDGDYPNLAPASIGKMDEHCVAIERAAAVAHARESAAT